MTKFSRGLVGGKNFPIQIWLQWKICYHMYLYPSPILNWILTKLGRFTLQMKISRRGMLLDGKIGYYGNNSKT